MSYARVADDCDVYIYDIDVNLLVCGHCPLYRETWYGDIDDTLTHLREHVAAGHTVPVETFTEIEADRGYLTGGAL